MVSRIFTVFILIASAVLCVREGLFRSPKEQATWDKMAAPPMSSFSTRMIDILTFGHRGLYDDFVAIWTVQLLADPRLKEYANKDTLIESIRQSIKHAPKLESLYILSCFTLALDFDSPEFCEEINRIGLTAFPNSWRIPMIQGFMFSFKLGDNTKAAAYFGIASTRPESPAWVSDHAKKLVASDTANEDILNETIYQLRNVAGGTKLIELLKPRFKNLVPAPVKQTEPIQENQPLETPHP